MPGPFFWFFAVVALVTLVAAVAFVIRPSERMLATLRPLCAATIFSALASFFLGVANGLIGLKMRMQHNGANAATPDLIIGGVAESLAPLVIGCALVSVAWLLTAVGLRRQA